MMKKGVNERKVSDKPRKWMVGREKGGERVKVCSRARKRLERIRKC